MIAIVDYKAGNLTSVQRALEFLGHRSEITDRAERIVAADRVILPGVGAAGATMENLRALGLVEVLRNDVARAGKPFLGICIGIQVLFDRSDEDGAECLGIIAGRVARYPRSIDGRPLKVPQIGWNRVRQTKPHRVFAGVPDNTHFYFVNSYYPIPDDPSIAIGACDYGVPFTAAVARDNVIATQFHLEKSGTAGLKLLDNFCRLQLLTMLAKRIIPCLDVRDGKVTKGVQFLENVDVGDPVAMARYYYKEGADEIVFYDITASNERRGIMLDVVRAVAREIFIPFSVGGGLRTLDDMRAVLLAGAEKVSIDSGAVRNPAIISEGARAFGSQCIVLSMQVKKTGVRARSADRLRSRDRRRTPADRPRRARMVARGRAARRRRTVHQLDRSRRHQARLRSRNHAPHQRSRLDSGDRIRRRRRARASARRVHHRHGRRRDRRVDRSLWRASDSRVEVVSQRQRRRDSRRRLG